MKIEEDASSIEPVKLNVSSIYDDVDDVLCTVPLSTKNGKKAGKTSKKKLTCLQVR